jgi:gamma-glutamyl hydrolase
MAGRVPLLLTLLLHTSIAVARNSAPPPLTLEPVIGILSVPLDDAEQPCQTLADSHGWRARVAAPLEPSCFTTFYSKWLEASGARTVVIPYNANETTLAALFSSVNGVLFTGGGLESGLAFNSTYMTTARRLYDLVIAANDAGDHVPLHGTCQGFQVLTLLTSNNQSVLSRYAFDSENESLPLDITAEGLTVPLFADAPPDVLSTLRTQNSTLNLHHDGVSPSAFTESAALTDFYVLSSLNTDRAGLPFVSTISARRYPITATQWHPERQAFEWRPNIGLNHDPAVVRAMAWVADFFVGTARGNAHAFPSPAAMAPYSLYGFAPEAEGDVTQGYQAFLFAF